MACFVAPAGVAVVTTIAQKIAKKRHGHCENEATPSRWTRRLPWLNAMLWGGSILLALEHVWHGEVVPWPPFLVASGGAMEMLREMLVYGGTMVAVVVLAWVAMVLIDGRRHKAREAVELEPGTMR